MKKAGWITSIVILLVSGLSGLNETITGSATGTASGWQQLVWFCVALYGVLGIVAGVALALRRPWCVTMSAAWAVATSCAATVASFAYNDPSFTQDGTLTGTIAAFVSTAVVGALIVWAGRVATRPAPAPAGSTT